MHEGVPAYLAQLLRAQYGEEQIALMQGIKAAFDPKNILNPGKVFKL